MSTQCKVDIVMALLSIGAVLAGAYHQFVGALLHLVW